MAGFKRMTFAEHINACLAVEANGEIKRSIDGKTTKEHNFLYKQEGRYYKTIHPDSDKDKKVKVKPLDANELQELMKIRYFRKKKEDLDNSAKFLDSMKEVTDKLQNINETMGGKSIFEVMNETIKYTNELRVVAKSLENESLHRQEIKNKIEALKDKDDDASKEELILLLRELDRNKETIVKLALEIKNLQECNKNI